MIKWFFVLVLISFKVQAISWEFPRTYLLLGYPYIEVQDSYAKESEDFIAITFGALMEYKIDEEQSLNLLIDTSYAPIRNRIELSPDNKKLVGKSSVQTNFYSLLYSAKFHQVEEASWWWSLGPSMGLQTLKFQEFYENETTVVSKNRIQLRNYGGRFAIKYFRAKTNRIFYELAYYYIVHDEYTVINDSSTDAQTILELEEVDKKPSWQVHLNIGILVF